MKRTVNRAAVSLVRVPFLAIGLWLSGSSLSAATAGLQRLIPEVRLKDGTVLHDVTFVSVGGSSITGKWAGGRGSIPLVQLPDGLRAELVPAAATAAGAPALEADASVSKPTVASTPAASGATAGDIVRLPTDLKLTNGFVMHEVKVVNWLSDAMTVNYVGGQVLVKMENIDPQQRPTFEAHRVLVYARQKRIDAARAARASGGQVSPQTAEETAEELKVLVAAGVLTHQLVIGMTKKEVFAAIGAPARTATDASAPAYLYWFYPGGGRDAKGAPCDRIVGFNQGILDGWKDQ